MKKNFLILALGFTLAFSSGIPGRAQQPPANPYDLLGRALTPIATIFSPEAQTRALTATLVLEEMTGLQPDLIGMRVDLALQPPDHVLIRFPYQNQPVTFCRAGDAVWITPDAPPFNTLPGILGNPSGKKKKKGGLGPMVLPFPPQQLALLPILFQVKDAGQEDGLRRIEARLMPELAREWGIEEWSARLTVNEAGRPVRIRVLGPGWTLSVRVESLEYASRLPAATWEAPQDAVRLTSGQVRRGFDQLGKLLESHRSQGELRPAE